jgi:pyridoxal phosphate enzyme (YggS family)
MMHTVQTEPELAVNLARLRQRVQEAAARSGRPAEAVQIVAVSKTVSVDLVLQALDLGIEALGENRVQEAREKFPQIAEALKRRSAQFQMVGHLQTNKAKEAVRLFDLIQSLDSERLARELDQCAREMGKMQRVLIEVNTSRELTKFGVESHELTSLIKVTRSLKNLNLEGLMTVGPLTGGIEAARVCFRELRNVWNALGGFQALPILSMGMTQDFEVAIEEGATMIRVGTAIFGATS